MVATPYTLADKDLPYQVQPLHITIGQIFPEGPVLTYRTDNDSSHRRVAHIVAPPRIFGDRESRRAPLSFGLGADIFSPSFREDDGGHEHDPDHDDEYEEGQHDEDDEDEDEDEAEAEDDYDQNGESPPRRRRFDVPSLEFFGLGTAAPTARRDFDGDHEEGEGHDFEADEFTREEDAENPGPAPAQFDMVQSRNFRVQETLAQYAAGSRTDNAPYLVNSAGEIITRFGGINAGSRDEDYGDHEVRVLGRDPGISSRFAHDDIYDRPQAADDPDHDHGQGQRGLWAGRLLDANGVEDPTGSDSSLVQRLRDLDLADSPGRGWDPNGNGEHEQDEDEDAEGQEAGPPLSFREFITRTLLNLTERRNQLMAARNQMIMRSMRAQAQSLSNPPPFLGSTDQSSLHHVRSLYHPVDHMTFLPRPLEPEPYSLPGQVGDHAEPSLPIVPLRLSRRVEEVALSAIEDALEISQNNSTVAPPLSSIPSMTSTDQDDRTTATAERRPPLVSQLSSQSTVTDASEHWSVSELVETEREREQSNWDAALNGVPPDFAFAAASAVLIPGDTAPGPSSSGQPILPAGSAPLTREPSVVLVDHTATASVAVKDKDPEPSLGGIPTAAAVSPCMSRRATAGAVLLALGSSSGTATPPHAALTLALSAAAGPSAPAPAPSSTSSSSSSLALADVPATLSRSLGSRGSLSHTHKRKRAPLLEDTTCVR